jgi:hypothetical protein
VLKNGSGLRLAGRRAARSPPFTHPTAGEDAGRYGDRTFLGTPVDERDGDPESQEQTAKTAGA